MVEALERLDEALRKRWQSVLRETVRLRRQETTTTVGWNSTVTS